MSVVELRNLINVRNLTSFCLAYILYILNSYCILYILIVYSYCIFLLYILNQQCIHATNTACASWSPSSLPSVILLTTTHVSTTYSAPASRWNYSHFRLYRMRNEFRMWITRTTEFGNTNCGASPSKARWAIQRMVTCRDIRRCSTAVRHNLNVPILLYMADL